jgi:hypothetical protein
VVRGKAPGSLPLLAQLLVESRLKTSKKPTKNQIENAQSHLLVAPDATVLGEAMAAQPDWFITHDKQHFLDKRSNFQFGFEIGNPGDLIFAIREAYRSS